MHRTVLYPASPHHPQTAFRCRLLQCGIKLTITSTLPRCRQQARPSKRPCFVSLSFVKQETSWWYPEFHAIHPAHAHDRATKRFFPACSFARSRDEWISGQRGLGVFVTDKYIVTMSLFAPCTGGLLVRGFWARVCMVEFAFLFCEGWGVCAGVEADLNHLISWIYCARVEWIVRGGPHSWGLRVVGIIDWLWWSSLGAAVTL